jgi:L-histidine Nalpha-methyltransferase
MRSRVAERVDVLRDPADARAALYDETRLSLRAEPKELPAVWLYDARGSRLYEEITQLPEYYPPRREREILGARAETIAERTRARTLVELGSGNANNTRILLDALDGAGTLERFVPFDVSGEMLRASSEAIASAYPRVLVHGLVGDFERDLDGVPRGGRRLVALLGSTIGNLYPGRRARFLKAVATSLDESDALLLGLDLVKNPARLEAAYDDSAGATEAFARNALQAVNRELGATFDQSRFVYGAHWDAEREWVDIGFRAREAHTVALPRLGLDVAFDDGELLRVEISTKFRRERFALEADRAGLRLDSWWTDRAGDFAVALLCPEKRKEL